jgi:hypothetical protein
MANGNPNSNSNPNPNSNPSSQFTTEHGTPSKPAIRSGNLTATPKPPKRQAVQYIPARQESESPSSQRFTACLIGAPGTWKTSMSLTAPKPIHILDVDGKFDQMTDTKYYDLGGVTYQQFTQSLTGVRGIIPIGRINQKDPTDGFDPRINPQGYPEFVATINGIGEEADANGGKLPFQTLVIDTFSRLIEHMKTYIIAQNKMLIPNQPIWDAYLTSCQNLINGIMGLPCNIIVTSHERLIEGDTGQSRYVPAIQGQFADRFAGYFQECYYMIPYSKGGEMQVKCLTRATRTHSVRSSLTELKEVPADFRRILAGEFRGEKAAEYVRRQRDSAKKGSTQSESESESE